MKTMTKVLVLLIAVATIGYTGTADADLITIGTAKYQGSAYNLIYDEAQQIVWFDYTRGVDIWENQLNWAANLGTNLTVSLKPGFSTSIDWGINWRLPKTDESKANPGNYTAGYAGPDASGYHNYAVGHNMVNSEIGHLYFLSLGNLAYRAKDGTYPQPGWGLTKTGDFENLKVTHYWSGTPYSLAPSSYPCAWDFNTWEGIQSYGSQTGPGGIKFSGIAVIDGLVNTPVGIVPEPATVMILGAGLAGLAALRRTSRRR